MIVRFNYTHNIVVIGEVNQLIDQSFSFDLHKVLFDGPAEHFIDLRLINKADLHEKLKPMAIMAYKRNLEELRVENKEA